MFYTLRHFLCINIFSFPFACSFIQSKSLSSICDFHFVPPALLLAFSLPFQGGLCLQGRYLIYVAANKGRPRFCQKCAWRLLLCYAVAVAQMSCYLQSKTILVNTEDNMVIVQLSNGSGLGLMTPTLDQGEVSPWIFWLYKAINTVL